MSLLAAIKKNFKKNFKQLICFHQSVNTELSINECRKYNYKYWSRRTCIKCGRVKLSTEWPDE